MVTEKDFKKELIATMQPEHVKILVDFANNFLDIFKGKMTKEELLSRINRLNYIGFEREEYIEEECRKGADAQFISSDYKIAISKKHKESDEKIIKALLYHELIHEVSKHAEKDLDTIYNEVATSRTGLDRNLIGLKFDEIPFNEGCLLEEIMTEYYSTSMLKKEGIDFDGEYAINCDRILGNDYVKYHGLGYIKLAGLGPIYDYLFGDDIFQAKFYDGNEFRTKFNDAFGDTDIFSRVETGEDYEVPCYSKFVHENSPMERYRMACKMFTILFKQRLKESIRSVKDLIENKELESFLNMLVKTRLELEKERVKDDLFIIIKEFEKDIINEVFGKRIKDDKYGERKIDIETSLFTVIEKIYNDNKNIDLDNVKYSIFYDDGFKGILLLVGDEKYIIEYTMRLQDDNYIKLNNASEYGFLEKDQYLKEHNIDITDAKFGIIMHPSFGRREYIYKDDKLYRYDGEEIKLSNFEIYKENVPNKEESQKVDKI